MNAMIRILLGSFLVIALLAACGTKDSPRVLPAGEQITEIEDLMKQMFKYSSAPNMRSESDSVTDVLKSRYDRFVDEYPKHEMAPVYLDQAANIGRKKRDYSSALEYYNRIINEYPEYENIIEVKFLIAFVYDAELRDKDKAREHYQSVADEYPNHVFGQDAKARLENLHMTDEELIEHFEKSNDISD